MKERKMWWCGRSEVRVCVYRAAALSSGFTEFATHTHYTTASMWSVKWQDDATPLSPAAQQGGGRCRVSVRLVFSVWRSVESSSPCRVSAPRALSSGSPRRCASARTPWSTPWRLWRWSSCDVGSSGTRPGREKRNETRRSVTLLIIHTAHESGSVCDSVNIHTTFNLNYSHSRVIL